MRRPMIVLLSLIALPAAAQTMKPGMWEGTSQVTSMSMPNMPAGMKEAMAGKAQTFRYCVRAEDVAKAPEKLFQGSDGRCRYTQFKMTGAKLDAVMQCQGGMTGRMTGTYTPTSYAATSDIAMTGGMKMTSKVSGRRVGDCK
jgi:hypothetical protein